MPYRRAISEHFIFEIMATDLAEAGGDYTQCLNAFLTTLFDYLTGKLDRDGNHCQVNVARDGSYVWENRQAENFGSSWVDGIDLSLVSALEQIFDDRIPNFSRLSRGANNRYRLRLQEIVE